MPADSDATPSPQSSAGYVELDVSGFAGRVRVRDQSARGAEGTDGTDGDRRAPVLLLIHGFSGSLDWFDAIVPLLVDSYRLIRFDLLGHGRTGGIAADAPLQARVAEAVLAGLGVDTATVVGHSFGADVAVELTERSDRIERLIIVTQAPDYSDAHLPRGNRVMTVPLLGRALHRTARGLLAVVVAFRRGPGADRALATRAQRDFADLHTAMFRVILVDRRERMAVRPLDAQVRAAGKPTLVLLGEKDHFYGARSAGRYEAAGAGVRILPESGHSPLIEDPEQAARLIRDFLRETSAD